MKSATGNAKSARARFRLTAGEVVEQEFTSDTRRPFVIPPPAFSAANFGKSVNYASYLAQSGVPETKSTVNNS